jgi:DNA-binding protein Alba
MKNAKVTDITIGTDHVTTEDGRDTNVSSMEITLTMTKKT